MNSRSSGVLLHITSLPGGHGVGDLGPESHRFVAFLAAARQKWWQMFPLGVPGGMSPSPYQSLSAFAGNPLLISLEKLQTLELLPAELPPFPEGPSDQVKFEAAWAYKKPLLRQAFAQFQEAADLKDDFEVFYKRHKIWLDDYALFCALKYENEGRSWIQWPEPVRRREPAALKQAKTRLRKEIRYHQFVQFMFFEQWRELKEASVAAGVKLMGDIPIFVAHDSADVWSNPEIFFLDQKGESTVVAGCPPDYFSITGQRWGNPLYRWDVLKKRGFNWWIHRFQIMFELFDATRLDHFIGFHHYWSIPADHLTAERGEWVPGPGAALFQAVFKKLGRISLVAEDLGAVTPPVLALRDKLGLPGMRVLQFAFGDAKPDNPFLPHNYTPTCVVYTGTHDNDTTVGWFRSIPALERDFLLRYLGRSGDDINWDLIRLAFSSTADTAIIPVQDLLGLGSEARMNTPGTNDGNWAWRLTPDALTQSISDRLSDLTTLYAR